MIDLDSIPISINKTAAPMDRELIRSLLLQGTGGADNNNDTPLEDAFGNFLQRYMRQQQQTEAQVDLLAQPTQGQQQHQQQLQHQQQQRFMVRQQQQLQQQNQQGMTSLGMRSNSFNQNTNINVAGTALHQECQSSVLPSSSSTTSGFAPGGLLHSFFSKQEAEEQERNQIHPHHDGTTPGAPFPANRMSQQPFLASSNMSNAGLHRGGAAPFPMGGASYTGLMGNRHHATQLNGPHSSSNMLPSSITGIPQSLSRARLSAPSLFASAMTGAGFDGAIVQPNSVLSAGANMRNHEWNTPAAVGSLSDFSTGIVVPTNTATMDTERPPVKSNDQGSTTNPYADNGTIGPWSAASAALLGDLALDSEEKGKKKSRKNNKDKPKRPLSAYNIFFKEERERILQELPGSVPDKEGKSDDTIGSQKKKRGGNKNDDDRSASGKKKPHGKIDFQSLAKIIGKRWQSLNEAELQTYKGKAIADMKRYRDEMETYNAALMKGKEEQDQQEQSPRQLYQFLY